MNIKRSCIACTVLVVTVSFLMVLVNSVLADEQVGTQSMIMAQGQVDEATQLRLRLRSQLKKETGLSAAEIDAIDPLLEEALRLNGGDTEPVRIMVRRAVQADCVGECLMERLRNQNRLMLKEHKQLDEAEQVASQERLRTRTRDGEQSGDLTRTETQTEARTQSGSGSGSGGGGSKGR